MRIGIDCRLWDQTGVGRYTRNLVLNLQKIDKKNNYVLFARNQDLDSIKKEIKNKNWRIVSADVKWHSVSEQFKFLKILNKEKLDLVHFPYISVPVFYNRPFVITIHDLIPWHFSTGKATTLFYPLYLIKVLFYKLVIRAAAQKTKKIIVPSKATKKEIIDHLKVSKEKIEMVYEGADAAINHQSLVKKYGKYFLYVGNAYPHKNLERLMLAFNLISKGDKDLKLILVGNKDFFYRELEEKNPSDKIIFYGKASDEELASLYSNAIALVLPSLMEGFGLPVLEAMTNKCPVLASDIPSIKEVAGDFAVYFDPKNISDILDKMKYISSKNFNREKITKDAYEKSREFSWEKAARETLKIYESSLSL